MSSPAFPYSRRRPITPVPGMPALETKALCAGYEDSTDVALRNVDLCVPVGARVALVGSNGAGKSTLLKVAAGLLPVMSGEIRIFGQPVGACQHLVAYLPQRGELDWRFPISLRRLVMTGRYVHLGWLRRPGAADWAVVDRVIAQLELSHLADRQIGQLSGGQQQRALFARALAQEAALLLLDEPLNAVDNDTRAIIANVLDELKKQQKTVVTATHDLGRLESDFDSAVYLCEGEVIPPPPGAFADF